MLSRAEVVALARDCGLGEWAERVADTARPGWRLEPDLDGRPEIPGVTKIGGGADLAPGEEWPTGLRGIPMALLAQINTAKLPSVDPWTHVLDWQPDGRLLRIFADVVASSYEPGRVAVLVTAPDVTLRRTTPPPLPDPLPPPGPYEPDVDEDFTILPEAVVRPVPFLSAPEVHPVLHPDVHLYGRGGPLSGPYSLWRSRLRLEGRETDEHGRNWWDIHTLLGQPSSIQDDVRYAGPFCLESERWSRRVGVAPDPALMDRDAWRVLLDLRADERIDLAIFDGGAFTVIAPVADLAQGRNDRAICHPESS